MKIKINCFLLVLAFFLGNNKVIAQGTLFTYQGHLIDNGQPANGTNYGMVFYLYDAATNGDLLGNLGIASVTVSNGLFTVPLDFGNQFTGMSCWLQITVQTNGGAFTTLMPRQQLTPTPYAIFANTASNLTGNLSVSQLTGTIPSQQLPSSVVTDQETGVTLSGIFSGDGSGLSNTVTSANYLSASSTASQPVVSPNTFQNVQFDTFSLNGWTYFGGGSDAFICRQAGTYLVEYGAEVATTSTSSLISLRAYNLSTGVEIAGSEATITTLPAVEPSSISRSFLVTCSFDTMVEFQFTGSATAAELIANTGQSTLKPSFSCTFVRIQ
jgi:hypothetical protein